MGKWNQVFERSSQKLHRVFWRGVRVAEGARLESVCRGNPTEGSNPSLSAKSSGSRSKYQKDWRGAGVVERGGLENR